MADLPVVLVFALRPVRLRTPPSVHPYEERGLDCRWYLSDKDLAAILARERPDVIVSFGDRAAFGRLQTAPADVRRRWLHFEGADPAPADLERAGAMAFCLFLHRALANESAGAEASLPLVSVFTPTWRPGGRLQRAYRSLLSQAHDNWEWVVVDDSDDQGVTLRALETIAGGEPRLSIYSAHRPSGKIGEVKRHACALARGVILVELDHDDELMPNALTEIVQAFRRDPEAGFVYSDWALIDEQSGEFLSHGEHWAFGYGSYRTEHLDGRAVRVVCAPPINAHTIRHIVGVPNHVRAWRRDVYWQIGGHNPALHVADDYDLLLRTFLSTRMTHIPKLCYLQHLDRQGSVQVIRRAEIQRLVRSLRQHYEGRIHDRLLELGIPDPVWSGGAPGGRPTSPADVGAPGRPFSAISQSGFTPPGELLLRCYGVRVRVRDAAAGDACVRLLDLLPPEVRLADAAEPDVRYEVRRELDPEAGADRWTVSRDDQPGWTGRTVEGALHWLRTDIDFQIATRARDALFVHAGVVGWRNRAIVIAGRSGTGKTRLVEELVRCGARYYSDEYAVLDDDGLVHSYARVPAPRDAHGANRPMPLEVDGAASRTPLPVGLIVAAPYREGASWSPEKHRGVRAIVPLVDNTVLARREPARMIRLAARLARTVVTLEGVRPDAGLTAPSLLHAVDELLDGADGSAGGGVGRSGAIASAAPAVVDGLTTADVSYVIPTAIPHDHLRRCLDSIRSWSPGSEIVVVANGCAPHPGAVALADRVIRLEHNLRFGAGANRGALEASRRLVCVMNDDARFVDDTPVRLVGAAATGKIVGPFSNGAKRPQGPVERHRVPETARPVDMVTGVCMMMRTDLFRDLGGFDARLDTWEDDDLCLRAMRLGVSSEVVGDAYVEHEMGATFRGLAEDVRTILSRSERTFRRIRPRLAVVAIARNEAGAIEGFFRQFAPVTRAWCLLDTGSTDGTQEVARRLGVRVESCVFQDFAHARNAAMDTFGGGADWVVMLDPDERLDPHTIRHIEALAAADDHDIFLAPLRALSPDGSTRSFVPKPFLFRSTAAIRWTLKVHEKLIGSQRQALVSNAAIDHVLALHDDARRADADRLYRELQEDEPYFTDPDHRARLRAQWPILDYDRLDDDRLRKVVAGPLVSVVIPTYRRQTLLTRAVRSVLAQDYLNLDVVVVGDGCPDLDAPLFEHPRVRIVNLAENHGPGGAVPRNYGIMLAAGEIVAYLDDDNEWLPDHVSSVYEAMRAAGAPFGFSSMQVDGSDLGFDEPASQRIDTSCVLHHKSLIGQSGFWKSRQEAGYAHDWEFFRRVIQAGRTWVCTRKPTVIYRAETSGQKAFLRRRLAATETP